MGMSSVPGNYNNDVISNLIKWSATRNNDVNQNFIKWNTTNNQNMNGGGNGRQSSLLGGTGGGFGSLLGN